MAKINKSTDARGIYFESEEASRRKSGIRQALVSQIRSIFEMHHDADTLLVRCGIKQSPRLYSSLCARFVAVHQDHFYINESRSHRESNFEELSRQY